MWNFTTTQKQRDEIFRGSLPSLAAPTRIFFHSFSICFLSDFQSIVSISRYPKLIRLNNDSANSPQP